MKRRKFIITAIIAAAGIAVPTINYTCRNKLPHDPLLRPDMLACFCDEKTIREIGDHYRSYSPNEDEKPKLIEMILKGYSGKPVEKLEEDEVSSWICKKVREDFKSEKMVMIDGWVLSETEARQCALLSLN